MTVKRALKCLPCLQALAKVKSAKERRQILTNSPDDIYDVISDIAKQTLTGVIPVKKSHRSRLKRYKKELRGLIEKASKIKKKRIIEQRGGFLPLLIKPALTVLGTLAAHKLMQ